MTREDAEILVKASSQGFNIAIHGIKSNEGLWQCAVERNEIIFPDFPNDEHVNKLETERLYEISEFDRTFEEAFRDFDNSEWFLCHPAKLHEEFAALVLARFQQQMEQYDLEFPADTPMERFMREKKREEWHTIATKT